MGIKEQLEMLRAAMGDQAKLALLAVDIVYPSMPESERISLKETLKVIAIPHWCDQEILAALCEVSQFEAARRLDYLHKLNVVELFPSRGPNTVNVHEATRIALRQQMHQQQKDYFLGLSERASAFFLSKSPTPANSIEWLYHLLIANPKRGVSVYEKIIHQRWSDPTHMEDRWALTLVVEELGKCGMLQNNTLAEIESLGGVALQADYWEFLQFRLDKATATLWRGDQVVPLRPKSFAALCYLLERHGQLVTKDELLDAVWQRRSVGEAVLKVCINELRQALCDNASQQTYLIAVPGCGYQLDVQVVERSGWGEKMKLAKYPTPTSVNSPPRYRQSHEVVEQSDGAVFKLSERETEIMDLVRKGKTNAEIGSILCIGPYAVKYQLHQIFRKLDVYNRTQAASKIERGLPLSVNSPIAPKRGRKLKIF